MSHFSDVHDFSRTLLPQDSNEVRDWIIDTGVEWFGSLKQDGRVVSELTVSADPGLWIVPGGAGRIYETPVWNSSGNPCGMLHVVLDKENGTLSFSVDVS